MKIKKITKTITIILRCLFGKRSNKEYPNYQVVEEYNILTDKTIYCLEQAVPTLYGVSYHTIKRYDNMSDAKSMCNRLNEQNINDYIIRKEV